MSGKLLAQARKDLKKVTTGGGFEESIVLKKDNTFLEIKGLTSGITERYDTDGNAVYSQSSHITINEEDLKTAAFPYLNQNQKVSLKGCKVEIPDEFGVIQKFVINETMPNKTTGLIICILGRDK